MSNTAKTSPRPDPEVRRAQILDEAIQLFGETGYHGFRVKDLADRCGLTNGGLLYHFGSKEQILLAVLDELEHRLELAVTPIIDEPVPENPEKPPNVSLGTVCKVLRTLALLSQTEPDLMRLLAILQAEALNPDHPAHAYCIRQHEQRLKIFCSLIEGHVSEPLIIARQVTALLGGYQMMWLETGGNFDIASEWDLAIAKLLPPVDTGEAQ